MTNFEVIITEKRIKNIIIRVKGDMKVYVSCPFGISQDRVIEFIDSKSDWILKQMKKAEEQSKREQIRKNELEDRNRYLSEMKSLEELISKRLPIYEEMTGLKSSSWHIREMKTRWGSCNTRTKRLCFNLLLIKYPISCLDYVILHELSHIKYPNHSKEFWKFIEGYMPDYKMRRRFLKNETI